MSGRTFRTQTEKVITLDGGGKFIRVGNRRNPRTGEVGELRGFIHFNTLAQDYLTSLARESWRMTRTAMDDDPESYEWRMIEQLADQMDAIAAGLHAEVNKRAGHITKRQRIEALRNVKGRTPEEAALYKAKADELERDL